MTLSGRQRALLFFVSAAGYTAWFSGLGNRSEAAGFDAERAAALVVDERPPLPPVAALIRRDPFATYPPVRAAVSGTTAATDLARVANAPANAVIVPDIETRAAPPSAALTLVLRATIVGPDPVAYVANGTAMDIVRVGDTLGDRRVTRIDLRGIVFSDGTRLDLPDSYEATPRPEPASDAGERISLAALRRLLLPARAVRNAAGTASPAPQSLFVPSPAPQASTAYPTPGPLPTADARGLPVGVNPTPDASDPTPYPYPYPYAPPAPH